MIHVGLKYASHQSHKKAGTMWRDAGLRWSDFLPEDVDVNKFVTEKVRGHSLLRSHFCFLTKSTGGLYFTYIIYKNNSLVNSQNTQFIKCSSL